jgi:hypothetical protein
LWTSSLLGPTMLWFAGAVFVVGLFGARGVSKESEWARKTALRAVGAAALVAGLQGLYVFSLVEELIFVPLAALLVATRVVAGTNEEHAPVAKLLDAVLLGTGVAVLVYVGLHLARDVSGAYFGTAEGVQCAPPCVSWLPSIPTHRAALADDWRSLAMPMWLTAGLLPLVYVIGASSAYEYSFLLIDFCDPDREHPNSQARRRAKLALLVGVNVHVRWLGEFRPPWTHRLFAQASLRSAVDVARGFRRTPLKELRDADDD